MATTLETLTAIEARLVALELVTAQILKAVKPAPPLVPALVIPPPAPVPAPAAPAPAAGKVEFFGTFSRNPFRTGTGDGMSDNGLWWVEQKAGQNRATVAAIGREAGPGLRLHTEPGDSNVSGSGAHERNDVALRGVHERFQGQVDWWAHSVLFPDDYAIPPPGHWNVIFDFHDTRDQGGQANFHIFVGDGGRMTLKGFGGQQVIYDAAFPTFQADAGTLVRNKWYDFAYHVGWHATNGFFDAWLGGKRILSHVGPTLYEGFGVYLKLANYHSAHGKPSSIIHDRVIRGTSAAAVALTPLE